MPWKAPSFSNPFGKKEAPISHEGGPKAQTRLHFFRHGKKAGGNGVPQEEDIVMELKPEGWEESHAMGRTFERLPEAQSAAIGSERLRARQTAAAKWAAHHPAITGEERSIEEILEKTGENGPFTRVWIDPRLDMPFVKGVTPNFDRLMEAFEDPNRGYVPEVLTLHEEAVQAGSPSSSIHARQVRGIAGIIERYARITPKLVDNPEAPKALERFLGTHGGIQESFWLELIRRTKGEEEMKRLLSLVPNGVAYNQGMTVDILSQDCSSKPLVHIRFSVPGSEGKEFTFDEDVPVEIIQQLVTDFS